MGKSAGKPQAKTLAPIEEGSYHRHADEESRISNLASDKVNPNPAELLHAGLSSPVSIGMLSVLPEIAL